MILVDCLPNSHWSCDWNIHGQGAPKILICPAPWYCNQSFSIKETVKSQQKFQHIIGQVPRISQEEKVVNCHQGGGKDVGKEFEGISWSDEEGKDWKRGEKEEVGRVSALKIGRACHWPRFSRCDHVRLRFRHLRLQLCPGLPSQQYQHCQHRQDLYSLLTTP